MKSSSFTCITPLLPNRGVSPYVIASPSATCMEPSNRAESTPSYRERPSTIPRYKVVYLHGDGHREENEPVVQTHGLRATLVLTVPKARHPKASLVPTSACEAKDATFNRHHHESPTSSQHGGRLCSVRVLESELLRISVSEKSIGNCEVAVRHQRITRGTKDVWKRAPSRDSVNAIRSHVLKHLTSTVGQP